MSNRRHPNASMKAQYCRWPNCRKTAKSEVTMNVVIPFVALCSEHRPMYDIMTIKEWEAFAYSTPTAIWKEGEHAKQLPHPDDL